MFIGHISTFLYLQPFSFSASQNICNFGVHAKTTHPQKSPSLLYQNNIRPPLKFSFIQSVPEALIKEKFANQKLRLCVPASDLGHVIASCLFIMYISHYSISFFLLDYRFFQYFPFISVKFALKFFYIFRWWQLFSTF